MPTQQRRPIFIPTPTQGPKMTDPTDFINFRRIDANTTTSGQPTEP
ncbi:MAG: hypothetical protein QNK92_13825 [Amylibacter sp.]